MTWATVEASEREPEWDSSSNAWAEGAYWLFIVGPFRWRWGAVALVSQNAPYLRTHTHTTYSHKCLELRSRSVQERRRTPEGRVASGKSGDGIPHFFQA